MKSAGGTELQVNYLNKYLDLSKYENIGSTEADQYVPGL